MNPPASATSHPSSPSSLDHDERIRLKQLVRQHVHDVRNYVNCANMEATLLAESAGTPELVEGLASIRQQLEEVDKVVTAFSRQFAHYPDAAADQA